jgi:hypothetical protein
VFSNKQEAIAKVLLTIINFCIRTGHVLHRWRVVVNTMIFKDPGIFKIHRLRVLHIYEADLNLILAVEWRDLLRSTEVHGRGPDVRLHHLHSVRNFARTYCIPLGELWCLLITMHPIVLTVCYPFWSR